MASVFRIARTGYVGTVQRPPCSCRTCSAPVLTDVERSAVANGWKLDSFRAAVKWLRELSMRTPVAPPQPPEPPDVGAAIRAARSSGDRAATLPETLADGCRAPTGAPVSACTAGASTSVSAAPSAPDLDAAIRAARAHQE